MTNFTPEWFDKLVALNQEALDSGDDHGCIKHVMVSRDQLKVLLDAYESNLANEDVRPRRLTQAIIRGRI